MKIGKSNQIIKFISLATLVVMISLISYVVISGVPVKALLRITDSVPMDNYNLAVRDYGEGKPTIIFESGLCVRKKSYYKLQTALSKNNRVISYDHAGVGESTYNNNPRTLPYYVQELKVLMQSKNLQPPYILIGHSLGGHIIRYYTHLYPDEVAGLVFLDHPHEDWFRYIRRTWSEEENTEYFKMWNYEITSPDQVCKREANQYDNNNDLIRGRTIPKDMPVLMFTGKNLYHFRKHKDGIAEDTRAWRDMQSSLLHELTNSKQIIDEGFGHFPHLDMPELLLSEINQFIDNIKTNK